MNSNHKFTYEELLPYGRVGTNKPCSYVDNGGIRRESYQWFSSKEEAEKYFPNRAVEWPVKEGAI